MIAAPGARRRAVAALAGIAGVAALCGPVRAAGQEWTLEARVGRLDFDLAPTPPSMSVGLGLGYQGGDGSLRLVAGVPTGENDPLWAALGGGTRLSRRWGVLEAGIDLSGSGFLQRYRLESDAWGGRGGPGGPLGEAVADGETLQGYGVALQGLPLVELHAGPAQLRLRAGASWYRAAVGDATTTRRVPLADLRLLVQPTSSVALTADLRQFDGEAGAVRFAGAGVMIARPELILWGSAGRWLGEEADAEWSIGARIPIAERLRLALEARQQTLDPLYGSSARRAWDVGLQLALSRPPEAAAPVPAGYRGGRAVIALPVEAAEERPSIAGDFNDWTPVPMTQEGDRWIHLLDLEPGVYEYAFVDPRGEWFVPEGVAGRKDDGMGGHVALLIVEGEPEAEAPAEVES